MKKKKKTKDYYTKVIIILSFLIFSTPYFYKDTYITPTQPMKIIQGIVTMYTSDPAETDDTPNITANGETTKQGTIACPKMLPFGTRVEIKGKPYTCNDRMGKRYRQGDYFDIWSPSKEVAISHGRQKLEVKVINTPLLAHANSL